eukprot:TRINITY_DN4480_c0_g1_i1.p1 TRINITY_DN4480_c0_g1~~TRINITY_DN4480_c0_g1_i1.p1  ORF type:complete len:335 (+),score=80.73 TRINITY_DN4480_c0_g1_i1:37-1041(+)
MPAKNILFRKSYEYKDLSNKFPPVFTNGHKKYIYNNMPPLNADFDSQEIRVTKWDGFDFPEHIPKLVTKQTMHVDSFTYPQPQAGTTEWHVNFADAYLFGFYGGGLFAQDEKQAMEMPCLASVKEMMEAETKINRAAMPMTRVMSKKGGMYSTPVLIKGALRRVDVDTTPCAPRPNGLYGRAFSNSTLDQVKSALTYLQPPTVVNIIAIEAPKGGRKLYTVNQIADAFGTAYSGFIAAKIESNSEKVIIHTGNWGTGAFGGNKILMACLQMIAAQVAEIDELIFHSFDELSAGEYLKGKKLFEELCFSGDKVVVDSVLDSLLQQNFLWGVSDGN